MLNFIEFSSLCIGKRAVTLSLFDITPIQRRKNNVTEITAKSNDNQFTSAGNINNFHDTH